MTLNGSLDPSSDRVRGDVPSDPRVREAHNVWIFHDGGRVTIPRIAVEAIGSQWADRGLQANVGFPDGRALNGAGRAASIPSVGHDGRTTIFGAGPLQFECTEPFERWSMYWSGPMRDTSVDEQLAGVVSESLIDVEIDVEMTMAVPPWVQGEMSARAAALLSDGVEGAFMGGERFEQLFRCEGTYRIGDDEQALNGTGLRIQRYGVRETAEFWGHNWQSALFPSGRAFGFICYPPRPDGEPSYQEAYVWDRERMHPARIVEVRWLTSIDAAGDDVSVILETDELGAIEIDGMTHGATYSPEGGSLFLDWTVGGIQPVNPVTFQQSGARYTWGEESTYGMVERSLPDEQIERKQARKLGCDFVLAGTHARPREGRTAP